MALKPNKAVDALLRSMIGVDAEELAEFGEKFGQMIAGYGEALARIELAAARIEQRLDRLDKWSAAGPNIARLPHPHYQGTTPADVRQALADGDEQH